MISDTLKGYAAFEVVKPLLATFFYVYPVFKVGFRNACSQVGQGVWGRVGEQGIKFVSLDSVTYVVSCAGDRSGHFVGVFVACNYEHV